MLFERFLDSAASEAVEAFRQTCAAASAVSGTRTYAVGDVHGCAELLLTLLDAISSSHPPDYACRLVFIGDLIDRGPEIAKTVAVVRALQRATGVVDCLRGNHEQMMIDWLREGDDLWLANGGVDTVESFTRGGETDEMLVDAVEWMEALPTWREDEARLFVHAGLRPGLPYDRQKDDDRLWIREGFLDVDYNFGKHVIHGHTPRLDGPERRRFRTNIDTGAVYGGALTTAVLDERSSAPVAFLRAAAA